MSNTTLPNPDVYLNHLPPSEARQFEIARDLYIAVIGFIAGDILSFIPQDIRVVKRSSGITARACFVLIRFIALVYMAFWATLWTTPVSDCQGLKNTSTVFCVLTMASTAFLFLRRVQAVYADNRKVRWFFGCFWVASSGVNFALIPGTLAAHIPGTKYCSVYRVAPYVHFANFMPAIFDTLVFFAVSYRLAFQAHQEIGIQKSWTTSWFSTKGLPQLQAAMIKGGQQYYLIAFLIQFVGGVLPLSNSVPPFSKVVGAAPGVALSACMACRAHRTMIDAYYQGGGGVVSEMSAPNFAPGNRSGVSNRIAQAESGILNGHGTAS